MRTLYLRNVPDEVVHRLETLAGREGLSVSAMAVRELAGSTRRAANPLLLGDLPSLGISTAEILEALDEGRADR
ncbi:antitoxin [Candidatus Poriferisocius sp.]|uniref:antitoxin n=1 Tax=Candidatus Poriferisocius sp. TaxID=3101276 RepID=UPI003B51A424